MTETFNHKRESSTDTYTYIDEVANKRSICLFIIGTDVTAF